MPYLAMIGTTEWVVIIGVLILFFGGRKLPELARAMGRSITEFKEGLKGDEKRDDKLGEGKRKGRDESEKTDEDGEDKGRP